MENFDLLRWINNTPPWVAAVASIITIVIAIWWILGKLAFARIAILRLFGVHFKSSDFSSGGEEGSQRSHYAKQHELKTILKIRDSSFPGKRVSGNKSYYDCHKVNPQSFKLVDWSGQYIGYWGIIPVSKDYYEKMRLGQITHAEMLSDGVISWEAVDPDNVYIYVIGIVTLAEKYLNIGFETAAIKVLLDAFSTIEQIFKDPRNTLKGAVGYPATDQGLKIVENRMDAYGFKDTEIHPPAKKSFPIRVLPEENVDLFLTNVAAFLDKFRKKDRYAGLVPIWSSEEREALVDLLGKPVRAKELPGAEFA